MELDSVPGSTRRITGNILMYLSGIALAVSALVKFARVPDVVNQMAASGFADGKLALVAALELVSAVLFLYPRTRDLGLLMISSFLGGAICTHVQLGELWQSRGTCHLAVSCMDRGLVAPSSGLLEACVGRQIDLTLRNGKVGCDAL